MNRARKESKKLKVYLGGGWARDISEKMPNPNAATKYLLTLAGRIFNQQRKEASKVYSVRAPEGECLSKGKAHNRYEFGCKEGMVTKSLGIWILGIDAIHENPYDGHTLGTGNEDRKSFSSPVMRCLHLVMFDKFTEH